jgi:hypothetical protein
VATVLILAREEVVSALLGLLVELRGYKPVYPQRGEAAAAACTRLACTRVVIDCDHGECSTQSLSALKKAGTRVLLFSPSHISSDARRTGGSLGIPAFTLPIGPEAFGKLLD